MLSLNAQKVLNQYFNLPFSGLEGVRCPYFNNARLKQRAQLRVLVGKGSPKDIVEEAKIISIQYHAGLFDKSGNCCLHNEHTGEKITTDDIRKFLIDNNLGIECSGFVTHILQAHFLETKKVDIARKFFKAPVSDFLRYFISVLRPIENIGVRHYADDRNTKEISWQEAESGDVIVLLDIAGNKSTFNHILLITDKTEKEISYAHARIWKSEGKYGHGVNVGKITIKDKTADLLSQTWVENERVNEENETWQEAKSAKILSVRRLNF